MKTLLVSLLLISLPCLTQAAELRLPATADIWLSDANDSERNSSAGKAGQIKLKTIQEMGAFRFDASAIKGKEVKSARLFLKVMGKKKDELRYMRVSTISQSWKEGDSNKAYGPASGATFLLADADSKKHWSHPYSQFADVVMGSGQTITTYGEIKREGKGWISIALTPELIYGQVNNVTDGLCVMDGGNMTYFNNFVASRESKNNEPHIRVVVGSELKNTPAAPVVSATADYEKADLKTGAMSIHIKSAADTYAWNVLLDGKALQRWQIPFPHATQRSGLEQAHLTGRAPAAENVTFYVRNLPPNKDMTLEVVALSPSGQASKTTVLKVRSSAARTDTPLAKALTAPAGKTQAHALGKLHIWAVPGLVKIDPVKSTSIHGDMQGKGDGSTANDVWNGKGITLHGARGETVSYQLVIRRPDQAVVEGISVSPKALNNGSSKIDGTDFELFKNWYAKNGKNPRWYPAFNVPMKTDDSFSIPNAKRGINEQNNQSILVDVWIPKDAKAGLHTGTVSIAHAGKTVEIPVELKVYDFELPDQLSFFVEFNTYNVPKNHLDYHRLSHQNRCVFNPWRYRPKSSGTGKNNVVAGKNLTLDWTTYDKQVGPLVSGDAFKDNRRSGVPTPCLYLPFEDNWPVTLTQENYHYKGPWVQFKGHNIQGKKTKNPKYKQALDDLNKHYQTAAYLGDDLQSDYTDGEAQAIKLFVDHFKQNGWDKTEMHQFYGGKKTHRIDYATNMWWMTDEPYHWDDWLPLQYFNNIWMKTIREIKADPKIWMSRGDISRPNWQGRVLDGVIQLNYGGFSDMRHNLRMRWLHENTGVTVRDYGGCGSPAMSYTQATSNVLHLYLSGASGFLPWQTVGKDRNLNNTADTALLVDGKRFDLPLVADMRLKGFRDGQQLIEYCVILGKKRNLSHDQIRTFITELFPIGLLHTGANVDNADSKKATTLVAWKVSELRKQIAALITE
ncbi:MAG: hypothetical protein HRU15_10390 [Planctomycetes bacterium]|nr:hypothetical protein [Planctomycetota bacterium]